MPTVIARTLSDTEQANREDASNRDLIKLLAIMREHSGASMNALAERAGCR
jgi:hypothetical protein